MDDLDPRAKSVPYTSHRFAEYLIPVQSWVSNLKYSSEKYPTVCIGTKQIDMPEEDTKDVWVEDTDNKHEGEVALMFANLFNK